MPTTYHLAEGESVTIDGPAKLVVVAGTGSSATFPEVEPPEQLSSGESAAVSDEIKKRME